jgi:hypothetical protein
VLAGVVSTPPTSEGSRVLPDARAFFVPNPAFAASKILLLWKVGARLRMKAPGRGLAGGRSGVGSPGVGGWLPWAAGLGRSAAADQN